MEYQKYPRVRYLGDGTSVTVANQAEEDALEGEDFDLPNNTNHPEGYDAEASANLAKTPTTHVHREYPKMMADQSTIVENEAEEAAWRALNEVETAKVEETAVTKSDGDKKKAEAGADDLL